MEELDDEAFLRRQAKIAATDLKSLKQQIKAIVNKAKEIQEQDLICRRSRLKVLLESEENFFEEEFAERVKKRIDDSFAARKEALIATNEERKKEHALFLESKQMQRLMEDSLEFREEMRHKLTKETQECQLYQMLEKEHARRREKDLDEYWLRVDQVSANKFNRDQGKEAQFKKQVAETVRCGLMKQIEEKKYMQREEELERLEDSKRMTALRREILLEDIAKKFNRNSPAALARGQEQRDDIERRRQLRLAEECEATNDHRKLIAEIEAELKAQSGHNMTRKAELNKIMKDFISYVRMVRNHEADIGKMRDDRAADLHHVDECTSKSMSLKRIRKERAQEYFSDLRCQVIEECKKRNRDEMIYNDRAIIENRFAREEFVDPFKKYVNQMQYSADLDQQIIETKRIWLEEMAAYEKLIKQCESNVGDYKVLMDYLDKNAIYNPHWKILACGKNRLKEIKESDRKIPPEDIPPEGRIEIPDGRIACDCENTCHLNKKCNFSFVP